jgi:hypothetical protein
VANFHRCCDGKGPTVVVVRSESGHVFGGATDGSWTRAIECTQAAAFLLGLQTEGNGSQPMELALKPGEEGKAMFNSPRLGPVFGGGFYLFVNDEANVYASSGQHLDTCGDAGLGISCFTANAEFTVAEYEVFAVDHV